MTENAERGRRNRVGFLLALALLLVILLAIAIVPPLIGIGRYKNKEGRPRWSAKHCCARPGFRAS